MSPQERNEVVDLIKNTRILKFQNEIFDLLEKVSVYHAMDIGSHACRFCNAALDYRQDHKPECRLAKLYQDLGRELPNTLKPR